MKTNKQRIEQTLQYHNVMQERNYDKEKELVFELQELKKMSHSESEVIYTSRQLLSIRAKIQTTVQIISDLESILDLWID